MVIVVTNVMIILFSFVMQVPSPSTTDPMAPQRISSAAANAFDDDVSIVDLPTFGKGGRKHGRSADAATRGDGSKHLKAPATKKTWKPAF